MEQPRKRYIDKINDIETVIDYIETHDVLKGVADKKDIVRYAVRIVTSTDIEKRLDDIDANVMKIS